MPNPLDEIKERLALRLRVQCYETQNEKDIAYLLQLVEELQNDVDELCEKAIGEHIQRKALARAARAEEKQP